MKLRATSTPQRELEKLERLRILISLILEKPLGIINIISDGQLVLLSTVLLVDAIVDLLFNDKADQIFKMLTGGFSFILVLISWGVFVSVIVKNVLQLPVGEFDASLVAWLSFILFFFTLIAGGSCKWVSE